MPRKSRDLRQLPTVFFELATVAKNVYTVGMPTKNVNLSDQQAKFINKSVHRGRFRNASEVVRAGLRMLEQSEREEKLKLDALRRIATQTFEEIDKGECEEIGPGALDHFMEKVDAKIRASRKR